MANQDYISRTPAKNKKNNRRNKKPTQQTNLFPLKVKVIGVLLVLLIGAAIYGLWSLKTDPSTKTPIVELAQSTQKNEPTLPKKPEEKWTYQTKLKDQKIEVGKYEVKEKGPYKMQCGSFKTEKQANMLKANIAFSGLESTIKTVTGKNGTWHKVFLGPYKRKRKAEKDRHLLKRNKIYGCEIWGWQ